MNDFLSCLIFYYQNKSFLAETALPRQLKIIKKSHALLLGVGNFALLNTHPTITDWRVITYTLGKSSSFQSGISFRFWIAPGFYGQLEYSQPTTT